MCAHMVLCVHTGEQQPTERKEVSTMTTKQYTDFIQDALTSHTIEEVDWVNKKALEDKVITTSQYLAAAQILAKKLLWS